jgi:hypothetical protein
VYHCWLLVVVGVCLSYLGGYGEGPEFYELVCEGGHFGPEYVFLACARDWY